MVRLPRSRRSNSRSDGGFSSRTRSGPNPRRASAPGLKFSTRTSAERIRSVRSAAPSSDFKSMPRSSCSDLRRVTNVLQPRQTAPNRACRRRDRDSAILITSAPMSPRSILQSGPASTRVRSMTRMPQSGSSFGRVFVYHTSTSVTPISGLQQPERRDDDQRRRQRAEKQPDRHDGPVEEAAEQRLAGGIRRVGDDGQALRP